MIVCCVAGASQKRVSNDFQPMRFPQVVHALVAQAK